uniref:Peptide deformylase n=1 Tax=Gossypium raimondii TaxID=29730 RepID=A0A0D2UQU3_GOSRA|nr:hypothetical protein B456_011G081700 [Gossypium raimondii]
MELLHKFSFRLLPPVTFNFNHTRLASLYLSTRFPVSGPAFSDPGPLFTSRRPLSSSVVSKAGWFLGLGERKKTSLPEIVKAGDPVLHEPAKEVDPGEIGSERIQNIIADMVRVMRMAPGVGLAAPQIGIPLQIIVLEDTTEYISYAPKEEIKAQDRRPFDLLLF